MTRRFVFSIDNASVLQQNAVTTWLRTTPLGFWHQLSHVWLIVDRTNTHSVATLRDQFTRLVPGATLIVVAVEDPKAWAGFGPTPKFEWLGQVWEPP